MNDRCFCCGAEVPGDCPSCWSGHVRVGSLEFIWNGFVAKRVEVAWCRLCDAVWFVGPDGKRTNLCKECRERLLAVHSEQAAAEPAVELAEAAA